MRARYEFTFHATSQADADRGEIDPTLALLGAQGWEISGIAARSDGGLTIALQRPYDEDVRLPDEPTLSAALAEPLAAPSAEELRTEASG
jgi:hypothetical protein